MVWAIIGWILLGLLALLLLLLFVPITLYVKVGEGALSVRVRVLFVWLNIFPFKTRVAKKKLKKKKTPIKEETAQEEVPKKKTLQEMLAFLQRIITSLPAAMKWALRGFWLRRLELVVPVHDEDAAMLARKYGIMQALIGTTRAMLSNVVHLNCKRLVVIPDYLNKYQEEFYFSCNIVVSPIIMGIAGILGFVKFLLYKKSVLRKKEPIKTTQKEQA